MKSGSYDVPAGSSISATSTEVQAWTKATPQRVEVVGGGQPQVQPQTSQQMQPGVGTLSADGSLLKIDHKGTPSQQQMQEAWERTQYGGRTRNEAEELKQLQEQWRKQQDN